MRTLLGLTGIALIGIGIVTLIAGWRVGLCAGVILLGCVLVIDAVIK
jgi:hypothetical protein